MDKKNLKFFGIFIAFVIVLLSLYFVLAAESPTALTFEDNTTANYDKEGIFTLNWTTGGTGDFNYTIYIYADDVLYTSAKNNSDAGYSFINTTDANYTFTVESENSTGKANSTNISMIVDTTIPSLSYTTGTPGNDSGANRTWIFVNVSASDTNNDSLVFSLYNSTGLVNQTSYADSYATLTINWTSLPNNKVYYFNVTANDSATNENTTSTRTFYLDGTVPTVTASCSPSSVTVDHTITCSCSGSDATSGINTSLTTTPSAPSASQAGTFTYTCSYTDNAGNSASASASYTVTSAGSSSGSASSSSSWTSTHAISEEVFGNGYTKEMGAKQRVRVKVENNYHYIGVVSLTTTKATISITSDPIQIILGIGEDTKVDVTDDGFYDMYIILNSIANNKADITMQKIYEEIPAEEEIPIVTNGELEEDEEEGNLTWLWILIAVVVLAAIIGGGIVVKKGKRKQ